MAFGQDNNTPRQVFYPSCAVNMEILFDEALSVIYDVKSAADIVQALGPPPSSNTTPTTVPLFESKDQANQLTKLIGIVPKMATISLNGIHQASTFDMTFPLRDFPLDPRVIRQMAVTIHLDSVDPGQFAVGLNGPPGAGRTTAEKRQSVLTPTTANEVLYGVVDNIDVNSGEGGDYVHMSGRDLRGIFLDTPIVADLLKNLDLTKPIDNVVSQILNYHPRGPQITVDVADPFLWPNSTIPSPYDKSGLTRVNFDASGQKTVQSSSANANTVSFWDLVIQYCVLCGAIPTFVSNHIVIVPSVNIYNVKMAEQLNTRFQQTPFANGEQRNVSPPVVAKPESWNYRRVVYGRDVAQLKFERKLGGLKPITVIVTSLDQSKKGAAKLITAQFPPASANAARTTSQGTGGKTPQAEELRISVPGITSKDRLLQIAQALREQISRQEVGGSISTKNLTSFGGLPSDSDLLRLQPSDPIELRVDASGLGTFPPSISEYNSHEARSLQEEINFVTQRTGDPNLARVLVTTARGVLLQTQRTFRVSNVKYTWDATSGIAIDFDFQNYVAIRADPNYNPGTTTANQSASLAVA